MLGQSSLSERLTLYLHNRNQVDAEIEWTDIKQLDRLVLETEALGTQVEVIGLSGEDRPLYGVTVGDSTATRTIAVIAGCHAGEIIGPLSALSLLRQLASQSTPGVQFKVVPAVDPDFLYRNAEALSTNPTLQNLLSDEAQQSRDLEGYFTTDTYPECIAVRKWLRRNDRIDAYFSLHSSALIAPGLFFYLGSGSEPNCTDHVAHQLTAAVPEYIPLLSSDPTGDALAVLSPGLFEIPISNTEELN
ncbi:hypothetical protein IQ241_22135 [Romeria aff. gracilis LEGE 07310]|uniref:Peptidase M14 domain-containing protein n=1 Tax=Vasconcelosia minhoensis LEGE 07310 TaxID=915328 RepID=A0A8J7DSB4_9CYAN|nr:M14 family zinc carboxypeptidase [Romeria gracilis]MBE9079954.1 hypothetical protein [Romeria aff. gracilis LEGE 07310]